MLQRSRQVIATFAVTALLAGGAVAHAATSSSPSSAKSTAPVAAMDPSAATHSSSDCPNMGGESTPSTAPSSSDSGTSSTSTTGV